MLYVIYKGYDINWGYCIDFVCSIIELNIFVIIVICYLDEIIYVYIFFDVESVFMFCIIIEIVSLIVYFLEKICI